MHVPVKPRGPFYTRDDTPPRRVVAVYLPAPDGRWRDRLAVVEGDVTTPWAWARLPGVERPFTWREPDGYAVLVRGVWCAHGEHAERLGRLLVIPNGGVRWAPWTGERWVHR